ncbi:hypothetical protein GUJ93_ZPchr0008g12848 [Zizania palustris]|uniref:Uncharacterized protein n=1 Tax=Zizania palustris TaxID=103762 RepID=A0A8J5RV09_ZIZPA|nr:hypothetical protein GUJ93_ZPchr0008g12848 [Zizania palustris]
MGEAEQKHGPFALLEFSFSSQLLPSQIGVPLLSSASLIKIVRPRRRQSSAASLRGILPRIAPPPRAGSIPQSNLVAAAGWRPPHDTTEPLWFWARFGGQIDAPAQASILHLLQSVDYVVGMRNQDLFVGLCV